VLLFFVKANRAHWHAAFRSLMHLGMVQDTIYEVDSNNICAQPWHRVGFETVDDSKVVEQKVSARRRLIRGAFVAPAALTLFNGSAFAQASMTCVSKQVADPVLPPASGMPDDRFLRVPLYGLGNGGNISTWIKGADVVFLVDGAKESVNTFLSRDDWLCVSNGQGTSNGGWKVGNVYEDPQPKLPNGSRPQELRPAQLVAVRVDASGNIVGIVGTGGDLGSAVGWTSCWASFTGIARYN